MTADDKDLIEQLALATKYLRKQSAAGTLVQSAAWARMLERATQRLLELNEAADQAAA